MTAPKYDLTACVEAAAQALYDFDVEGYLKTFHQVYPDRKPEPITAWHEATDVVQTVHRAEVLPIVRAVLAVVEAGE